MDVASRRGEAVLSVRRPGPVIACDECANDDPGTAARRLRDVRISVMPDRFQMRARGCRLIDVRLNKQRHRQYRSRPEFEFSDIVKIGR